MGFGLFLGTQFTGAIMDAFKTPEGKFRWRAIYLVPCALTLFCAVVFLLFFREEEATGREPLAAATTT